MPDPKPAPLVDGFQRQIKYLRLSVTDRCDLRCTYCMPERMTFLPRKEVLSLEELYQLSLGFIARGVTKIRVTGGEPLVRRDIVDLFRALGRKLGHGLEELTLTTNATQLASYADDLARAGVRRVNVSLDTRDPAKFAALSRRDVLPKVLEGVAAAKEAGLKVKINTVALKGVNEAELPDLIAWSHSEGFDHTLIEVMPLGELGGEDRVGQYWGRKDLKAQLAKTYTLSELAHRTGGPARYLRIEETGQQIGLITPLTHNFCESCNRVRLTCTGELFMCLGQEDNADLRSPLRADPNDNTQLEEAIRAAIRLKPKGHDFDYSRQTADGQVSRHMSHTGG